MNESGVPVPIVQSTSYCVDGLDPTSPYIHVNEAVAPRVVVLEPLLGETMEKKQTLGWTNRMTQRARKSPLIGSSLEAWPSRGESMSAKGKKTGIISGQAIR
jgi:hypothetical protein